jgi:hypothetical protein
MTVVFGDGTTRRLNCSEIEATYDMHASARSHLIWLKEKEPFTFAELVLSNNLKRYAEEYSREYLKQQDELAEQLEAHYQDKAYAQAIAREIMMRGD